MNLESILGKFLTRGLFFRIMYKKFRIIRLQINNHDYLNTINLQFQNEINNSNVVEPFTNLIIGANGTGKSQILRIIADIFRELEYQKYREKKLKIKRLNYVLEYQINNSVFRVESKGKSKKDIFKNNQHSDIFHLILPERLIVSSFMLNDKFLFIDNSKKQTKKIFYEYGGIRSTSTTSRTRTYLKRIIENIVESSTDLRFLDNLEFILEFLELKPFFNIFFHPRFRPYFFKGEISSEEFTSFFKDWKKHRPNRKTEPYSIPYFNKLNKKEIKKLVSFINRSQKKITKEDRSYWFEYNILTKKISDNTQLIEDFKCIKKLMKLDLLSYPGIEVQKLDEKFNLSESSSGEYHFISTIVGILAKIKDNSLVLIDEPEISLHPNWQIRYVNYLKKIFANYPSCQFIIATHSHFMVSDLKKESSSIISLKKEENGGIKAYTHPENTYGWSTEDILLNIFEVTTVRNYYLADKIGNILTLISDKDQNINEIKTKVRELKKIKTQLKEIDPLKEIMDKLFKKFG